ncbi:MAG: PAS domain S-box protein [Candidatus Bathyarchaeota archaeon]|nr:PAS domain S-box protein [Candidatus Bathyarchaeota archaeon]
MDNLSNDQNLIIPSDVPIAIYELDLSTLKLKWANRYVSSLLGYSETELSELKVTDLLCGDSKEVFQANIQKAITSKQTHFSSEVQVKTKNGSTLWGLFNSKVIFAAGKPSAVLVFAQDITRRKKLEDALRLSEDKFAKAFLNSPYAVTLTRLSDGRVMEANESAIRLFGTNPEEAIGKESLGFWADPRDRTEFMIELSQKGSIHNREIFFLKKDGTSFPADMSSSIIIIHGEKYLLSILTDITERKNAEEALKESEKLYRTLFDNSEDGFMLLEPIFDEKGTPCDFLFLKLNSAYERMTGSKADDVLGKRASQAAPDLEREVIALSGEVCETGRSIRHEAFNRYSNKWFDSYFFPYAQGKVGILFRDVTERKKTEEALRLSKQRLNEIVESISDDLMVLDHNWNYLYANSQAGKILGLEPKEIVGRNFWELYPQNKGTYIETSLREAMDKGEIKRFELLGQYSERYKLITTYPSAEGIVLIATDITERRQLEKQLQDQERLAAIGSTAGMVGHDIRNPLQAIIGDLYLMRMELDSPLFQKESLLEEIGNIEKSISYINKIVADLQDYAKPLRPEYSEVEISEVMATVVEELAVPKEIEVSISTNTFRKLKTDPTFIRRILTNLINNAIQAMPKGGTLELASLAKQDSVVIYVSDSGVGIPEDVQPKLFTPMMTTKAKGQGLGLAVVKRLVEALGGKISFESQVGAGTKFLIELPTNIADRQTASWE